MDLSNLTDDELKEGCNKYIFELWQRNKFNVIITKEFFADIGLVFNQIRNPDVVVEYCGIKDMVVGLNEEKQLCVIPLPTILDDLIEEDDFFEYRDETDTRQLH